MQKDPKPYKILIIEDNPGDIFIVNELLLEMILSPEIFNARSFKDAIFILEEHKQNFDVIILDLMLPDKQGQHLINEITSIVTETPIIILTGYSDLDFSTQSISMGISDYLIKDDLNAIMLYKSIIYSIERVKFVKELKTSERRYIDLFNLSPQPIWVYSPLSLKFIQVNKAAVNHYGYSESEFLNMTILDIRPEDEIDKTLNTVKENLEIYDRSYFGKFRHKKKSGELIDVEISSTPVLINEKRLRFVIVMDVTEKYKHERQILKAIIKTQEEERYEIGAELHDNICQILASSQMSLVLLKNDITPEKQMWFEQSKEYVSIALREVRNISHRLAPAFVDDLSFKDTICKLFDLFNVENKFSIEFNYDDTLNLLKLRTDLQLNLYRILQEQLRNIEKYAKAKNIKVDIYLNGPSLIMCIADNGVGFNSQVTGKGIGMSNIKRRVELFNGKFEVESSKGNGCSVKVSIPANYILVQI